MDIKKIRNILKYCTNEELRQVEALIPSLVTLNNSNIAGTGNQRYPRKEDRYKANLKGTLKRLSDIKPDERKEFSVNILDISRSGMRIGVKSDFVPSHIVQISFKGPNGKMKECLVEVVRIEKKSGQAEMPLELGCRSVDNEYVRRLTKNKKAAGMTESVLDQKGVLILIVGTDTAALERKFLSRTNTRNFNIRCVANIPDAIEKAKKLSANLAIFYQGTALLHVPELLAVIKSKPSGLATLAIIENDADRFPLLDAGIDECLTKQGYDSYLLKAMERTLLIHEGRRKRKSVLNRRALIFNFNKSNLNPLSIYLKDMDYSSLVISDLDIAQRCDPSQYDIVLADYGLENREGFKKLLSVFHNLPMVALCKDSNYEREQAMADGASKCLSESFDDEDVRTLLNYENMVMSAP